MKGIAARTDRWGIASGYHDLHGRWRPISRRTHSAIRAAIGRLNPENAADSPGLKILEAGETWRLPEPADLIFEDGTSQPVSRSTPRDLPFGYYELKTRRTGARTRLIVRPRHCYLPASLKAWGWAVQLYALRSKHSWGMGDFGDLHRFNRWAAREGHCDFVLANPLGAATPILPQQSSPYYPGSRRFWNPLYLCVENVPGAAAAGIPTGKIAAAGRALNRERLIDRDAIFKLKMTALEKIWRRFPGDSQFESFCREQGAALQEFAAFCSLAARFQCGWTGWPAAFRRPEAPAVRSFMRDNPERIDFHRWLQWRLHQQLARAVKPLPLMQDLPIGVDPGGADAWVWQDLLARGISVGAPPDLYNTLGQNWGLPAFVPHRLRAAGYEPFRQTIRAMLRLGGGLRIDHVMGLFRLFWIPENCSPGEGAFVHYPATELLAILAVESQRARAFVVGEDLGTVEPEMRAELRRRKILSYRLLWFESRPVKRFPRQALSAVTTHDLFTIAGLWNGSDLRAQKRLGLRPNEAGTRKILKQFRTRLHLPPSAGVATAIAKTHELLARTPSQLITASLDDALMVEERPNMPGTLTVWPNWSLALPASLETIRRSRLAKKIARACRRRNIRFGPKGRLPKTARKV